MRCVSHHGHPQFLVINSVQKKTTPDNKSQLLNKYCPEEAALQVPKPETQKKCERCNQLMTQPSVLGAQNVIPLSGQQSEVAHPRL